MGRIGAEELERLKRDSDLLGLVRGHGVELTTRGDELTGLCPFHPEETPSFSVNVSKAVFNCFGCGASGSVIDWVMRTRGCSFRNAVELLREGQANKPMENKSRANKLAALVTSEMGDQEVLNQVVGFYAERYWHSEEAKSYAQERLIGDENLVRAFRIGFADRTLGYRLPPPQTSEGKKVRERLFELGLSRDTGHESFRGHLTIPILDDTGNVVGLYGRRTLRNAPADKARHMYLKGAHRGVFNLGGVRGQETVILCEAIIDALTFVAGGISNATCSYGVNGLTSEIVDTLKASCRKVFIAYDRDGAGDVGAEQAGKKLTAAGMECFRVKFPRDLDVNAYAQKTKPFGEALRMALKASEWMGGTRSVSVGNGASAPDDTLEWAGEDEVVSVEQKAIVATETQLEDEPGLPGVPQLPAVDLAGAQLPPTEDLDAEEHHFAFGDRKYRVRGLKGNTTWMVMKVNLTARCGASSYRDTFDILLARARSHFMKMAATELGVEESVIKSDVGMMVERLEAIVDARLKAFLKEPANKVPEMTEEQRQAAMELLKDPRLMDRVVDDLGRVGVVGERTNKLLGYIAAVSRKTEKPLAVIIQSVSGAGKSSLMEAILSLMPDEEVVKYSAMTGQALYYMGETNLRQKILALAEEEGAEKAAYALKLLQSEGELTIASTGKDPQTGRHETKEYHVEGPVMVFVTTTAPEPDEEFLNRCLVLTVDESRQQTRAIHTAQKERATRQGILLATEKSLILQLHQNAQRLLRPLKVENPYAAHLSFPDHQTRTRRDFPKYLAVIEGITLMFQHQREVKEVVSVRGDVVETVRTTLEDIALANELAAEVFGQTLDEVHPQTRKLLTLIVDIVKEICGREGCKREDVRLTQREIREKTGWGNTQVKMHLARLVERELLIAHRSGSLGRHFYELAYDGSGDDGRPFLCGLTNVDALRKVAH